jgi:hypothetical protein
MSSVIFTFVSLRRGWSHLPMMQMWLCVCLNVCPCWCHLRYRETLPWDLWSLWVWKELPVHALPGAFAFQWCHWDKVYLFLVSFVPAALRCVFMHSISFQKSTFSICRPSEKHFTCLSYWKSSVFCCFSRVIRRMQLVFLIHKMTTEVTLLFGVLRKNSAWPSYFIERM